MDAEARDHIQRVIQDEAEEFFPGAVRRVTVLQPGEPAELDEQDRRLAGRADLEPGELVPQVVLTAPPGTRPGPVRAPLLLRTFRYDDGPAIKQFRQALSRRLPELRHFWIKFEDAGGRGRGGGGIFLLVADEGEVAGGDFTAVMVRLKAEELEIVDTLITAGIANNRAEAIRWALTRIRERPAYEQLQAHTREIERLKTEFLRSRPAETDVRGQGVMQYSLRAVKSEALERPASPRPGGRAAPDHLPADRGRGNAQFTGRTPVSPSMLPTRTRAG